LAIIHYGSERNVENHYQECRIKGKMMLQDQCRSSLSCEWINATQICIPALPKSELLDNAFVNCHGSPMDSYADCIRENRAAKRVAWQSLICREKNHHDTCTASQDCAWDNKAGSCSVSPAFAVTLVSGTSAGDDDGADSQNHVKHLTVVSINELETINRRCFKLPQDDCTDYCDWDADVSSCTINPAVAMESMGNQVWSDSEGSTTEPDMDRSFTTSYPVQFLAHQTEMDTVAKGRPWDTPGALPLGDNSFAAAPHASDEDGPTNSGTTLPPRRSLSKVDSMRNIASAVVIQRPLAPCNDTHHQGSIPRPCLRHDGTGGYTNATTRVWFGGLQSGSEYVIHCASNSRTVSQTNFVTSNGTNFTGGNSTDALAEMMARPLWQNTNPFVLVAVASLVACILWWARGKQQGTRSFGVASERDVMLEGLNSSQQRNDFADAQHLRWSQLQGGPE